MKLTRHNGRSGKHGTYNPKHNDRTFDVSNSEHIDEERAIMVDNKKLTFTVGVDISYIDKEIQKWIYEYIKDTGFIKPQQITALRNQLNEGAVNQVGMLTIFNKCMMVKTPSRSITFSEKKLTKYFPESYSADDMEQVIESLLEKWSQEQND